MEIGNKQYDIATPEVVSNLAKSEEKKEVILVDAESLPPDLLKELTIEQLDDINSQFQELELTQRQRYVLSNWTSGLSLTVIGANCGLTGACICNWIRRDANFKKAIQLIEQRNHINTIRAKHKIEEASLLITEKLIDAALKGNTKVGIEMLQSLGVLKNNFADSENPNDTKNKVVINVNLSQHNEIINPNDSNDSNDSNDTEKVEIENVEDIST